MDLSTLPEIITGYAAIGTSLIAAIGGWRKAIAAQAMAEKSAQDAQRALHEAEAMRDALSHFGAHRQAVGVVLNFPGQPDRGVFDYMTQHGWALAPYKAHNAAIPTDPRFADDMKSADVLIVQGATKEEALAVAPMLAEMVTPGGGIILYNESGGVQHVFRPWGPSVQGATTIGTTDLWARAMYARRAYMAAYEGAERGSLAELKAARQG